jgi:hypothetical protein
MNLEEANIKLKPFGWGIHSNYEKFYKSCLLMCDNGHIYKNVPYSVVNRKRSCKFCSGDCLNTETMNKKLNSYGFQLVGNYNPTLKKHKLKCLHCETETFKRIYDIFKIESTIGCKICRTNKHKEKINSKQVNKNIKKLKNLNFYNFSIDESFISSNCQKGHKNLFQSDKFLKNIFCEQCVSDHCLTNHINIVNKNCEKWNVSCSSCGYSWETAPTKLLSSNGCILCNFTDKSLGNRWRPTDEQYKYFLKLRGFSVDSTEIIKNSTKKIKMTCPNGHHICITPSIILRNPSYQCGKCIGKAKLTYGDICERLKGKEITLLDHNPPGVKQKAKFRCDVCENTWFTKIDCVINSKSGCPFCCTKGFNQSKDGFFYIHKITHFSGKEGLKIGITNNIHKRKLAQCRLSNSKFDTVYNVKASGVDILRLERFIKKKYKNNFKFFTKDELSDGYTESIDVSFYENIINDVNDELFNI